MRSKAALTRRSRSQKRRLALRTQFGSIVKESEVCVLCAKEPATTKEHIPSRGVFLVKPKQYLTVPACERCNNSAKLDDQYFRDVLAACSTTEEGRAVWRNKVMARFKERPATKIGFRDQIAPVNVTSEVGGSMVLPGIRVNAKRFERCIRKMVWGLYWWHSSRLLDPTTPLDVHFLNFVQAPAFFRDQEQVSIFRKAAPGVYRAPGEVRTFCYLFGITAEVSIWYFIFYRQNMAIGFTDSARRSADV